MKLTTDVHDEPVRWTAVYNDTLKGVASCLPIRSSMDSHNLMIWPPEFDDTAGTARVVVSKSLSRSGEAPMLGAYYVRTLGDKRVEVSWRQRGEPFERNSFAPWARQNADHCGTDRGPAS